jgi:hypothetical protein
MNRLILILFVLLGLGFATAEAAPYTTVFVVTNRTITIPAGGYTVSFQVDWFGDDYPQSSAPGRIELRDAGGNLLGRVSATHYRTGGASVSATVGSISNVSSFINIFAVDGSPADGSLLGDWNITGVPAGQYTLRFYEYRTDRTGTYATTVWTETWFRDGWSNSSPPTISWTVAPASAGHGQGYSVTAHGHDDDGDLTQVNVWKNGQPFAFAGGGDGRDQDSGNPTSDNGPQTVVFTAQAVDATGATSPMITHVVNIGAPANQAPSVALTAPGNQSVTQGTTLTLSSRATDADGNLTNHNLDIQRPAGDWNFQGGFSAGEPFQGGPVGSTADSTRTASFTFSDVGVYTIRAAANDGSGWVHSGSVSITVTAAPPVNRAPTISWISTPGSVAHQASYSVSARGEDADGNLTQVNVWKNGTPFAFGGGGSGYSADSGNPSNDSGPQVVTFTAQAVDGSGAVSAVISQTVTVGSAPPTQYTLSTSAGAGGTVSAGGVYANGTVAWVTATPDAIHDFSGWSGDASGSANPFAVTMDRSKSVQAVFALKSYPLVTAASTGGSVTAGGNYPHGTTVTVSATAAPNYRFTGWAGDASGSAGAVAVLMTGARSVQALFVPKSAQTISFPVLPDQSLGAGPVTLNATATSGLPVTYAVVSGPATITGNQLMITGAGVIVVEAQQPGDGTYLSAPGVSRTFSAVAAATVKYRPLARVLLQTEATQGNAPYVIERP